MSRRNLLAELIKLHDSNDAVKRGIESYQRFLEAPDMAFYRDMLRTIQGAMLQDVFSNTFTELDATEKDVQQRAYFQINQLIDFLIAPSRWIQKKKLKTTSHAERMAIAKVQAQPRANDERSIK